MSSMQQRHPKKPAKGGTVSTRKHRFQSFNQRIAKLNIDPIRRRRRGGPEDDDAADTASYFESSLKRWKDLNLSENFANFTHDVEPLCNSLPQVLHHNQRIFGCLTAYLEKGDALSLQPLLDLLGSFAHDLGVRFEDHFPRAVTLVASLAAKNADVEVIEWSFTCLAWLFKYLSRLLVPNLEPLFNIMAPFLGKTSQKIHIARFAAESMSFLVRKAALSYQKDTRPLASFVDAVRDDLLRVGNTSEKGCSTELYQYGLMTLFINSVKGIERQLHSCGIHIYRCLIDCLLANTDTPNTELQNILCGVTIALVHHTNAAGLKPIIDIVLEFTEKVKVNPDVTSVAIVGRLLLLVCTVRKGSRIQEWSPLLDASLIVLELCKLSDDWPIEEIYKLMAVTLQSSPMELVLPKLRTAMDTITSERHGRLFLPFCCYFNELGRERFQTLLFPYFSKFVVSKWHENEHQLYLSIPKLVGEDMQNKTKCPELWQARMVAKLEAPDAQEDCIVNCFHHLEALNYLTLTPAMEESMMKALGGSIFQCLQDSSARPWCTFMFGPGLRSFVGYSTKLGNWTAEWWPLICQKANLYSTLPPFLEAILLLVNNGYCQHPTDDSNTLVNLLVENLHSASHELRKLSLQILDQLYAKYETGDASVLATALLIENSPLDLQSARSLSMHVRKLASDYEAVSSHPWLQKAVPHFCFGLLTFKLSQIWDDAVMALKSICNLKIGADIVTTLSLAWLENNPHDPDFGTMPSPRHSLQPLNEFQCSNLNHVENLVLDSWIELNAAAENLQARFDAAHSILTREVATAPALALRVLSAVPQLAERRSRYLVPKLLSWAADDADQAPPTEDEDNGEDFGGTSTETLNTQTLKHRDRKALLDLFGHFNNPKTLYKSADVLQALKYLLTNGDAEIQTSALKALFTWKLSEIQPYEENLLNLLDDARFREEISTFLHTDIENNIIREDHRAVLIPVVLRLLYGKTVSRVGTRSGKNGQIAKRKAVLGVLSRFDDDHLRDFVEIALGRLHGRNCIQQLQADESNIKPPISSVRKQLGLVNMMKSILEVLGGRLSPLADDLSNALLYCLVRSERDLVAEGDETHRNSESGSHKSLLKAVRQTGIQCLDLQFRHFPPQVMMPYLPTIYSELLSRRLDSLAIETAQSVSGTLHIFSTWASSRETVRFLVDYDSRTIRCITDCLGVPSAKEVVKLFVLEILKGVIEHSKPSVTLTVEKPLISSDGHFAERILHPNAECILDQVGALLRNSPSKELLASAIQLISMLAPFIKNSLQTGKLLDISAFLLKEPSNRVSPKTKGELLHILQHFIPMARHELSADLLTRIFQTVSSLFGYFKDRENRLLLSRVLAVMAGDDCELIEVASLCASLNSFSASRLDEPDFEERMKAFNIINEVKYKDLSPKQWRPLIYNMLFFVKDEQELAIRSNSSFALRRFVESNVVEPENVESDASTLVKTILLPALRKGATESSELVRTEYLSVMAHLIRYNHDWQEINDMCSLLVDDDEEASFFSNLLHIQQHRRLRALRRLAMEASKGHIKSANVAHFFIPLIEHFIFDKAEDETAHNLSAEAVRTIGALASSLEWPQFRAILRRFSSYIQLRSDVEKPVIKLLSIAIDALSEAAYEKENSFVVLITADKNDSDKTTQRTNQSTLASTMPRQEKFAADLSGNLLPPLIKYLHEKDESTVSLRVSATVFVIKLVKLLPSNVFRERLPPVLTDLCHILRSRAQESRDLTRNTLAEIATLIGATYFEFILKELRGALARGYQLHVLSFTVHSILVATSPVFKHGDLDHCLPSIVSIIMDDIFGAIGQEKDAEEYISKMKEVKGSKSYDSMELVAKTVTVGSIVHLIRPIQSLLNERLDLRMVKKIDELLRRIGVGLLRNEAIQDQALLVFCYEVIRDVYKDSETGNARNGREDHKTRKYLINSKGLNKAGGRQSTSLNKHRLARFALDVLRVVLHKQSSLQTPANLHGFIPIIGDTIVQPHEEVQISGLRLLTTIIKVPLKAIDDNAAIYVAECVKIVKGSTSTNVELAQAALKLVSAILRERRTIEIQEKDLAYLLKRLIPDLEEPDKQGVAFNFLKAIMTRKIVITEIYEVLDVVAMIMVTNQTRGARDLARGAYIQFVMDYPQSKDRFAKQLAFLVKNLDYKHQEGRKSVMEAIHLLFTKVGEDLVQEILGSLFVPLVMVIVNDESSECREMAGVLIKTSFERANVERTQSLLALLRSWLNESDQPLLTRVAYQTYGIFLDINGPNAQKEVPLLHSKLTQMMKLSLKDPTITNWELVFFGLQTFTKICLSFPSSAFGVDSAPLWSSVRQCLSYPHAWVKLSAAKLLGTYLGVFAKSNAKAGDISLPLQGSGGLRIGEEEIVEITRASISVLKAANVSEELASQSVRNLVFLGKTMAQTSMMWSQQHVQIRQQQLELTDSMDESDADISEPDVSAPKSRSAISYLLGYASGILRRPPVTTRAASITPLKSSLQLIGSLTHSLSLSILEPILPVVLIPLHNLTDSSIAAPFSTDVAFVEGYKSLVTGAQEIMESIQQKMGVTEYVRTLQGVKDKVKERREGRRRKRNLDRVAEPERAGRVKRKKREREKERKKERGAEQRGLRRGW